MINPEIQAIIRECVQEMRSWTPKRNEEDIFYAACGAVLKHAESQRQEVTPELLATIRATTRQVMQVEQ